MHELSPGPVYGLPNLTGQKDHDPSSKYSKSPAFSISPRREQHTDHLGPGPAFHPGEHVYRTGKDGGRTIIIRGKGEEYQVNPNPGPGQYDPQNAESKTKPSKPAFSFGKKGNEPKIDDLPGPGNYEVATKGNAKAFTMGGRQNNDIANSNPGPADYNMNPKVYRQGAEGNKGFTIYGRSESSQGTTTPGPGSYDYEQSIEKTRTRAPVAGFGGKAKDLKVEDYPGPGSYSPSWGKDGKVFTMGGRESNPKLSDTPGPGEYTVDANTGKGTCRTIRITGRPSDQRSSSVPGPGAYSPEPLRKGNPAFSMSEKREYKFGDTTPGPGSYNPAERKTPNGFLIRGRPQDGRSSNTPGPGEYTIPDNLSNRGKQGGNGYLLRGREKSWKRDEVPGPGSYSPEASPRDKTKGPQWSFGDKPSIGAGNTNPGPGSYNPSDGKNVKGFKMHEGKDQRGGFPTTDTPGPTHYSVDPNISNKIGKGAPAFSMKGRDNYGDNNANPGPGAYTPDLNGDKHRGPVYTFGGKPKDVNVDTNPGPGQYDPDPMLGKTVRSTKPSLPQFSLGAKYREY